MAHQTTLDAVIYSYLAALNHPSRTSLTHWPNLIFVIIADHMVGSENLVLDFAFMSNSSIATQQRDFRLASGPARNNEQRALAVS